MSKVISRISVSLDGHVAGPNQSPENPLGEGGLRLHQWVSVFDGVGAYITGRRTFGGGGGARDLGWRGWWGANPPYHTPTYVLTHHEREPLPMEGGATFHFGTGGIERLLEDVGDPRLEPTEVVASPVVTHVRYRVVH